MAEYYFRYSPSALSYLSDHANDINLVAGSLGVSPLSVAAGIAREQTLESDYYNYDLKRVLGNPTVKNWKLNGLMEKSDQDIRAMYDATNKLDPETLMYPGYSAASHPLLFGVGPGNIKLRTGISLLDNYNA